MSDGGNPQGMPSISQPVTGPGGIMTRPWFVWAQSVWNRTGSAIGGSVVPIGVVMDFAGPPTNIPPGWIACGQRVSRSTYANLFAVIGTTWGIGDGSSTFDLPPQNVFSKGLGSDAVGDTGGSDSVTLSIGQLPAHNHAVTDPGHTHVVTDPGHTHTITDPGHHHASLVTNSINTTGVAVGATQAGNTANANTGITINTATTGVTNQAAMTGVATQDTGTGNPVSTLPPYATFLKIIKT